MEEGAAACERGGEPLPLPTFFRESSGHPGGVLDSSRGSSGSDTPGTVPIGLTPEGSQNDGGAVASSLCDPSGVDCAFEGSGGIAALNPRLLSANPPGSRKRWLVAQVIQKRRITVRVVQKRRITVRVVQKRRITVWGNRRTPRRGCARRLLTRVFEEIEYD
jgi:hypothetical protein